MERQRNIQVVRAADIKPTKVRGMLYLETVQGSDYQNVNHRDELQGIIFVKSRAIEAATSKARQLRADLLVLQEPETEVYPDSIGVAILAKVEGSAYRKSRKFSPRIN